MKNAFNQATFALTAVLAATQSASLISTPVLASDACSTVLVDVKPKLVASGFQFTEGPAWHPQGQHFVFSDIPANTIYALDANGEVKPFKKPSGYANGNAFDAVGNLWSARHDRKLVRTDTKGITTIVLSSYDGKPFNSPNDLTIAKDGAVWFTDPPFGIQGHGPQKADEEQPVRGVYRILDRKVALMTGKLKLPNGIAFAPDGGTLYVADTSEGSVYKFAVAKDGTLSDRTAFAKLEPKDGEAPMADGIKVDREGNLWATGPGGIGIFSSGGQLLCRFDIEAGHVSNLAFGGQNGRDLLITAGDKVFSLRSKVSGH